MEGDGDFRSAEVRRFRNEADIIITNPPFSLFTEFFLWLMESRKKFLVIGNINAIKYKEVFPLIKGNKLWNGYGFNKTMEFIVPEGYDFSKCRLITAGCKYCE